MTTRGNAKGQITGRVRIVRSRKAHWKSPRLSDEEKEFIMHEIERGLMAHEVKRMFFRRFNRDVSKSTIYSMMKDTPRTGV